MKMNRNPVFFKVPESVRVGFDNLDLGVEAIRGRGRDAMTAVAEEPGQVALEGTCRLDNRLESRVRRPEIPPIKELTRGAGVVMTLGADGHQEVHRESLEHGRESWRGTMASHLGQ